MRRRTAVASIGAALIAPLSSLRSLSVSGFSPVQSKPPLPAEYEPFQKIAKAKGARIFTNQDPPVSSAAAGGGAPKALHLDMNMVNASIQNAIARTRQNPELNGKFQRLLAKGTDVQKVEFVHGSGTYYFPEDIASAIAASGKVTAAAQVTCWVCETVCVLVCTCLENSDQYCKDKCREVCRNRC